MKKAIILAGGKGSRLAPITDSLPKPLIPFLGKSLIERIIEKLTSCGIDKIMISTCHYSHMIKQRLGTNVNGADIVYLEETTPLGTAGGIVFAKSILGIADDEDFVVMSGDCVCDFDLNRAHNFHKLHKADATIITTETENPLEYGIVTSKSGGLITAINEKPCWSQVNGCKINTGVYVLKGSVASLVPTHTCFDFSKDLFPLMLNKGMRLCEYADDGYWCDVGCPESYYKCCMDAIEGKIKGLDLSSKTEVYEGVTVIDPCFIPAGTIIEKGAKIGPCAIFSARCHVGKNCEIAGSVVHGGVRFDEDCRVEGSIVCEGARLKRRCTVNGGSVIGKGTVLCEYSHLPAYSVVTPDNVNAFEEKKLSQKSFFDSDDGILLGHFDDLTKSHTESAKIGFSIATAVSELSRIGLMNDGGVFARSYCEQLASGVEKSGRRTLDFGIGFAGLARFQCVFYGTDCFVFVYEDKKSRNVYARLFNKNGLSPSRDYERRLEKIYKDSLFEKNTRLPKPRSHIENSTLGYYCEMLDQLKTYADDEPFSDLKVGFYSDEECREFELLKSAFSEIGGTCITKSIALDESRPYVFYSKSDGVGICQGNYTLDRYHMASAILDTERKKGTRSFALPYLSPKAYFGSSENDEVFFYPENSVKRFFIPKQLMQACCYLNDDIFLAARFLSLLEKTKKNLSEFYFSQPLFSYREKTVFLPEGTVKATVIRKLSGSDRSCDMPDRFEGIRFKYPDGRVTVVPARAQAFKIYSESRNTEIADSLCETVEKEILSAAKDTQK